LAPGDLSGTVLIKNNLTILYPVELHGRSGTGFIQFVKVLKQRHSFLNEPPKMNVQQTKKEEEGA